MSLKQQARKVAAVAITDEDVRRDPAKAFHVALATARAFIEARQ